MEFSQSAILTHYDKRIVNALKKIGYLKSEYSSEPKKSVTYHYCIVTYCFTGLYCVVPRDQALSNNPRITWLTKDRINCGDNQELFLGIAAINNRTSKFQFFMTDKAKKGCDFDTIGNPVMWVNGCEPEHGDMLGEYYHKMSISELISNKDKLKNKVPPYLFNE